MEVVYMTENTQFKTLVNAWLIEKRPMITPSTHANFVLIAENHLIPYFGRRKIGTITRYVTVALGLIQGTAYFFYLKNTVCTEECLFNDDKVN